jgi:tetratricopeptide (TPR) repeat protein
MALLHPFFQRVSWYDGVLHMKTLHNSTSIGGDSLFLAPPASAPLALPDVLGPQASAQLQRMFRDPRVLEKKERADLIAQLREAVQLAPRVPEVRVLLGMALCVDLQAQDAMEELREAVKQAPDSFIARLKFGELLMRLRICDQAADETQQAQLLASNDIQAEMARKQAATIRTMRREGIERGGFSSVLPRVFRFGRKKAAASAAPLLVSPE